MNAEQAEALLPSKDTIHVLERVGAIHAGAYWSRAEVRQLLAKAERIERPEDAPFGHSLGVFSTGRWFFVGV